MNYHHVKTVTIVNLVETILDQLQVLCCVTCLIQLQRPEACTTRLVFSYQASFRVNPGFSVLQRWITSKQNKSPWLLMLIAKDWREILDVLIQLHSKGSRSVESDVQW